MGESVVFKKIELNNLESIEIYKSDKLLSDNYSFIPKKVIKNKLLKFLNVFTEEKILNAKNNTKLGIDTYCKDNDNYFINPYDKKWYRKLKDGNIVLASYIRLKYTNGNHRTIVGINDELVNSFIEKIREGIENRKELFINFNNVKELKDEEF